MNNNGIPQGVNPLEPLLGPQWTITPLTWTWAKLGSTNGPVHLLVLETPIGRIGHAFTEQDLEQFIRTAQEQLTGLVLPRPNDVQL